MRATESDASILVVEDNPEFREVLCDVLASEGFRVQQTSDGTEALALLERISARVVLLDMNLPGISGEEVLTQILRRGTQAPAVVAMTGSSEVGAPVDAILHKPFDVTELLEIVRRYSRAATATAPVIASAMAL